MPTTRVPCATLKCPCYVPPSFLRARYPCGLCIGCYRVWRRTGLALAGFIPAPTLDAIRNRVLDHFKPDKLQVGEAIRYARGSVYRTGPWDNRPPYSIPKIRDGRAKVRLPHLILARAHAPSLLHISRGFTHTVLADMTLDGGRQYSTWLGGIGFQPWGGAEFADGRWGEVRTGGPHRSPHFRFRPKDHSILGTHCLKAAQRLGLYRSDFEVCRVIAEAYQELVLVGGLPGKVMVPMYATRLRMNRQHPLRHHITPMTKTPRQYHGKVRDQHGLIEGLWPYGIETPEPKPVVIPKEPPPAPDTDWLWVS